MDGEMKLIVSINRYCRLTPLHSIGLAYMVQMQPWNPDSHVTLGAAKVEKAQDGSISIFSRLPCFQQNVWISYVQKALLVSGKTQ